MSLSPPTSGGNPDTEGRRSWRAWPAVVPAVLAGGFAAWMYDWTAGITVASGVLRIAGQLLNYRKRS